MPINVNVSVDLSRLDQLLLEEIKRQIVPILEKIKRSAQETVPRIIAEAFKLTHHYTSLIDGKLRKELGISDGLSAVNSIIKAIQASIQVDTFKANGDSLGGVTIQAFRSDFTDALSANGARYDSINAEGRSLPIEWLSWLLFQGDSVIIAEYGVMPWARKGSRTDRTLMVGLKKGGGGKLKPWRMPAEFAGNKESNWMTDTAEIAAPLVEAFLELEGSKLLL